MTQETPVQDFLSRRAANALRRANIETAKQILALDEARLLAVPGLGPTILAEIKQKLGVVDRHPTLGALLKMKPGDV